MDVDMEFGRGEADRTSCGFAVILVRKLSEAPAYKPARLSISLRDFNSFGVYLSAYRVQLLPLDWYDEILVAIELSL